MKNKFDETIKKLKKEGKYIHLCTEDCRKINEGIRKAMEDTEKKLWEQKRNKGFCDFYKKKINGKNDCIGCLEFLQIFKCEFSSTLTWFSNPCWHWHKNQMDRTRRVKLK